METLLAMAPPPDGGGGGGGMISTLIMFSAIFALVYFLIIRPRMKRRNSQTGGTSDTDFKPTFLNFGILMSKSLIIVLFYIGVVAIVFAGIKLIDEHQEVTGIAVLILGVLLWRIVCEGAIVIFNIHDYTRDMHYKLSSLSEQIKSINKEKKEE